MSRFSKPMAGLRPRAVLRQGMGILPKGLRHALYRNLIHVDYNISTDLCFRLARSKDELEGAFQILHDEYVRSGFMRPHASGMRITPFHALPSTSVLVALWKGEVVGTVSVVRDGAFGFPMNKIFDPSPLKKQGARLAEISSLAIRKDFRQNRGKLLFPLLKFLYHYCIDYFGVDYMVVSVNPATIEFYESILFFQRLSSLVKAYEFVNGAPAVGAYLDLRQFYRNTSIYYGAKPAAKNLFRYFMEFTPLSFEFPDRAFFKVSDPVLTPELLDYFFNQQTQVLDSLSPREKSILSLLYTGPSYQRVIPPCGKVECIERRELRYDVSCEARVLAGPSRTVRMQVKDASLGGLRAYLEEPIRFGTAVRMRVAVADFEIAEVEGWPVWRDEHNVYGFVVAKADSRWESFIEHLASDLRRAVPDTRSSSLG